MILVHYLLHPAPQDLLFVKLESYKYTFKFIKNFYHQNIVRAFLNGTFLHKPKIWLPLWCLSLVCVFSVRNDFYYYFFTYASLFRVLQVGIPFAEKAYTIVYQAWYY